MAERERVGIASAKSLSVKGNVTIGGTLNVGGASQVTGGPLKVAKVALAAADTAGGLFAWQNPEASSIIVVRTLLDVTTKSTGACTVDVGTTATNATTSSDNLLDGVDVGTAAGLFGSINEAGTNGKSRQKLAAGKWVTGSKATGATAGIVGSAYIEYFLA